jgi:hypothetical protein
MREPFRPLSAFEDMPTPGRETVREFEATNSRKIEVDGYGLTANLDIDSEQS